MIYYKEGKASKVYLEAHQLGDAWEKYCIGADEQQSKPEMPEFHIQKAVKPRLGGEQ